MLPRTSREMGKGVETVPVARGDIRGRRSAGPDGIVEGGRQVTNRAAGATWGALSGAAAVAVCNQRRQSEVEVAGTPLPGPTCLPKRWDTGTSQLSRRTECSGIVQASDGGQSTEYK